jgi:septal ring factor EnvC (AmiA/AmiB activator)
LINERHMIMVKRYLPLSLLLVTAVFAQPGRGVGLVPLSWENQLNLTTEQLGQINQLRNQYWAQRVQLQADLQKSQLELRVLMQAERPNQKAIDAALAKIANQRQTLNQIWVQHRLEVRALLTPEQRVLFDTRPLGIGPSFGRGYGRGLGACDGLGPHGYGRRGGRRNW